MTEAQFVSAVLAYKPVLLLLCSGLGWCILADCGLTEKPSRLFKAAGVAQLGIVGVVGLFMVYELVAADMCQEWANAGGIYWAVYYGSGCWI